MGAVAEEWEGEWNCDGEIGQLVRMHLIMLLTNHLVSMRISELFVTSTHVCHFAGVAAKKCSCKIDRKFTK